MKQKIVKLALVVLIEISRGNPNIGFPEESAISMEDFYAACTMLKQQNLLEAVVIHVGGLHNSIKSVILHQSRVTSRGLQVLGQNTRLLETYPGLDNAAAWVLSR